MTSRQDVLDAALDLLREEGVAGLSMRRLGRRLGTSYQVIYTRVGGKGDIVRALHDQALDGLQQRIEGLATEPGSRGHVHELAQTYLAWAIDDPVRFELAFARPIPEFFRDAAARRAEMAYFRRTWVRAVGALLDHELDERPRGTALRLAWRLWTAVHGIAVLHLAGHDTPSGDPVAEVGDVVDLLLQSPLGPSDGTPKFRSRGR